MAIDLEYLNTLETFVDNSIDSVRQGNRSDYDYAFQETMDPAVIAFVFTNLCALYILDQKPKYKYQIMFVNALAAAYFANLVQIRKRRI